ncbi:hypothetical protein [Amycolatopsis samaneae]|uniref:Uncharacterized protein n=1 Tax=Amycolatopsis samaneae TaxID=664691 RepID=A0ABW5GFZ3_9PSEU
MPTFYEYHVTVRRADNSSETQVLDIHEDHHHAHGFNESGNLRNQSYLSSIIANYLQIAKTAIEGIAHYGVTKKR